MSFSDGIIFAPAENVIHFHYTLASRHGVLSVKIFFTLHNIFFTIKFSGVVINVNLSLVASVRYVYGVKWSTC